MKLQCWLKKRQQKRWRILIKAIWEHFFYHQNSTQVFLLRFDVLKSQFFFTFIFSLTQRVLVSFARLYIFLLLMQLSKKKTTQKTCFFHMCMRLWVRKIERRKRQRKLCEKINLKTGNVVCYILLSNFDHNVNF